MHYTLISLSIGFFVIMIASHLNDLYASFPEFQAINQEERLLNI